MHIFTSTHWKTILFLAERVLEMRGEVLIILLSFSERHREKGNGNYRRQKENK